MITLRKNITAVLFDFDGTIADTMEDNYKAWNLVLSAYGHKMQKEEYYLIEGLSSFGVAKKIMGINDRKKVEKVAKEKDDAYQRINNFKLFDGVIDLLNDLKKMRIKSGLVTGGSRKRVDKYLKIGGIEELFDAVVTADDTDNSKPFPDPYIKLLNMMNCEKKEECIAVENAPYGILSAKRAGLFCIAVESTLRMEKLTGADMVVRNIREMHDILKNGIKQ